MAVGELSRESSATVEIRHLEPGDLDVLFGPHSRHYADEWLARQQAGRVVVAVAVLAGQPVGRCGLDLRAQAVGFIWAAHVEPAFQSRGIGTTLLGYLEGLARQRGLQELRLGVGRENPRAQALYERLGYRVTGAEIARWQERREGEMIEIVEPCWTMAKSLGPRD